MSHTQEPRTYVTIPKLAQGLGVTPASVRDWIRRGYIDPAAELPATGERACPAAMAAGIERCYGARAALHCKRR